MASAQHRQSPRFWSDDEIGELRRLAKENTPTRLIAMKLGRSEDSVRSKAASIELSLRPANQSPAGSDSRRGRR